MENPIVKVEHLYHRYSTQWAIEDINLEIEGAGVVGLLGSNGAGKSTTMNIITGYLAATSGEVKINGFDVLKQPEEAKKCVGYLPELPPLYMDMTVKEYLDFVAELKKLEKSLRAGYVKEAMKITKTEEVSGRLIRNLSKGYRQRVGFAQAVLGYPEILILDEPTAGLDPAGRDEILDLIARMHKEKGITVILVSHSMEDVAKYVERIIVMNHGQVMFDNTPCEVFKHYKELEQIGLAAPQVTYLMHELKEKGLNVNTEATTVAEARESLLEVLLGREPNHRGSNLEEENLC